MNLIQTLRNIVRDYYPFIIIPLVWFYSNKIISFFDFKYASLLITSIFILLFEISTSLTIKTALRTIKFLKQRIFLSAISLMLEFWLAYILFSINSYPTIFAITVFGLWFISGVYRTVLEITPIILKIELNEALNILRTFSIIRTAYLLTVFLPAFSSVNNLPSLITTVFVFFVVSTVYYYPHLTGHIFSFSYKPENLKPQLLVLRTIYNYRSLTKKKLLSITKLDEKVLDKILKKLSNVYLFFLPYSFSIIKKNEDYYEFSNLYIIKQNIKFYDK